jgi:hypothetical protein
MGEKRNVYKVLVRNLEGKRPSGIPIHRWEDSIKMYLKEMDRRCPLNHLAHNRG